MLTPHQGFTYNKFQKPNDWPKIEDTFDYKYDNGKLIGGNENLFLSGPVTYEKVGNPVIKDGIASGFSKENYVQLTQAPDFSKPFEIVICFTKNTSVLQGTSMSLFDCRGINGATGLFIYMPSNTRISLIVGNNTGSWVIEGDMINSNVYPSINIGVRYYFKLVFDGSSYTGYIKTDSTQWITGLSISSTIAPTDLLNNPRIGVPITWGQPLGGSVDLNETYIKVNDSLWFYGKNYTTKNMVPVPAGLEYNNTTAPSNGWVYTNTDRVKGPVNYNVVGNPTITDGIASGFVGRSSYIKISSQLTYDSNTPLKFRVRFKSTTTLPRLRIPVMQADNRSGRTIIYYYSDYLYFDIFDTQQQIEMRHVLSADTWYIAEMELNNNTFSAKLFDDNGNLIQSKSQEVSFSAVTHTLFFGLQYGLNDSDNLVVQSIDLNQTYIKVNGQPWFGNVSRFQEFIPAPQGTMIGKDDTHSLAVETPIVNGELLSPKLVGPVGYTVVGNPTIVDGVASGFSRSDFINTEAALPLANANIDIEIATNAYTTFNNSQQRVFSGGGLFIRCLGPDWNIYFGEEASSVYMGPVSGYPYIKVIRTSGIWYCYRSSNGSSYEQVGTPTAGHSLNDDTIRIGGGPSAWAGSINLNKTYIKVNGKLWFGKEDWTPSTHTDNAIYLLGSHSTDYSTYNTQGINPTIETESDESGTYNVWIDNQEIYKEQSNPLDINWSNLALTTGYDITTPSTLKAHVIKVEPNNGNITRFSTDTNYKVENGLLTWASPKLYLEGQNTYSTIDNPTIVDDVYIRTSKTSTETVYSDTQMGGTPTSVEVGVKIKFNEIGEMYFLREQPRFSLSMTSDGKLRTLVWRLSDRIDLITDTVFQVNTWYWIKLNYDAIDAKVYLSTDGLNYTLIGQEATGSLRSYSESNLLIGSYDMQSTSYNLNGSIDLKETYIKVNDQLWFYGKNYATQNIAPVPAGYTYGSTTTPSIGYVDMRTQQFTAAPEGVTYGKDS